MRDIDRIITDEYSTYSVSYAIENVNDTYSELLEEIVPDDKFNELDECINEYIDRVNRAVFEQGFLRGIAALKGGALV